MQRFTGSVFLLLFSVLITVVACSSEKSRKGAGVVEEYKPEQPIEFSHDIHAGKNGIDCKYCHNSHQDNSNKPTAELCMKCHKQIKGRTHH